MKKIICVAVQSIFFLQSINAQIIDWVSLPTEVNDAVNCLTVYNGHLIVGGRFSQANAISTNKIAAWDGTNWTQLANGLRGGLNPFVYKTLVANNSLYAVGNFDTAGNVAAKDVAKWNDTTWSALGIGSNATIFSVAYYNNEIYVGGTFDSIGGIAANHIAKWDGGNWEALGSGIQGTNVNEMYVFKNELYAIGVFDSAGNIPCNYVARWNDTSWNNVSTGVNYGNVAMIEWDSSLLVGSELNFINDTLYQNIHRWDEVDWSLFSHFPMFPLQTFCSFNNRLYCAGGLTASGIGESMVDVWNDTAWSTVGTGINNLTSALCVYNGELYCGGQFRIATGAYHNFLARLTTISGIENEDSFLNDIVIFPNPVSDYLNLSFNKTSFSFSIFNVVGKSILSSSLEKNIESINISGLPNGIYFLQLKSDNNLVIKKFIVQN